MRRIFLGRKAQSITEYAILVSIIVGSLIAMQTYVRNSLSAKIKLAADGIHEGDELLYQPKTTYTIRREEISDGTKDVSMDQEDLDIAVTGAGSEVLEDFSRTSFQELEGQLSQ